MDEFEKFHRREHGLLPPKEKSTWELMKETASTPEEKQEIEDTELKSFKSGQHFRNKDNQYENDYGQIITPVKAYAERVKIRKEASKYLTDRTKLNAFVTARSYDDFKGSKTFENILNKLKEDK